MNSRQIQGFVERHPLGATVITGGILAILAEMHTIFQRSNRATEQTVPDVFVTTVTEPYNTTLSDDAFQLLSSGNPLGVIYGHLMTEHDRQQNYYDQ